MFFELSTADIQLKFKVVLLEKMSTLKGFALWLHICLNSALLSSPGITSSANFSCTLSRLSCNSKTHQISGSKSGKLQKTAGNEKSKDIPERQEPALPSALGLKLTVSF